MSWLCGAVDIAVVFEVVVVVVSGSGNGLATMILTIPRGAPFKA